MGITYVCNQFKILLHSGFWEKSLTLNVCKHMKEMKVIWWCHNIFWSFSGHFLGHFAKIPNILMNQQWLNCEVQHITLQIFLFINLYSFTDLQNSDFSLMYVFLHEILLFQYLYECESKSNEILFSLWTIICSNLTGYTVKFALLIC